MVQVVQKLFSLGESKNIQKKSKLREKKTKTKTKTKTVAKFAQCSHTTQARGKGMHDDVRAFPACTVPVQAVPGVN